MAGYSPSVKLNVRRNVVLRIWILIPFFTLMQIRIWIDLSLWCGIRILSSSKWWESTDQWPTEPPRRHFEPPLWASTALHGSLLSLRRSWILALRRIRILLLTLMRIGTIRLFTLKVIRIRLPKTKPIHADPDTQHCGRILILWGIWSGEYRSEESVLLMWFWSFLCNTVLQCLSRPSSDYLRKNPLVTKTWFTAVQG